MSDNVISVIAVACLRVNVFVVKFMFVCSTSLSFQKIILANVLGNNIAAGQLIALRNTKVGPRECDHKKKDKTIASMMMMMMLVMMMMFTKVTKK